MKKIIRKFELKVLKFIKDQAILVSGDSIVLAVSAGSDSICMLHLFAKWAKSKKWNLKVVYFDHMSRGAAKDESAHLKQLCEKMKLHFVEGKGDVAAYKRKHKLSFEEAARHLRYSFLKEQARKFNHAKIAVAHHLNDQVETFFIQLLKGSGLGGLSGMKVSEGGIIRPLLCVKKEEIDAYVKARKLKYFYDESNSDVRFLRNKVRRKLLPFLENNFDWNFYKTIPKMMHFFKEEHELLGSIVEEFQQEYVTPHHGGYAIVVESFKKLPHSIQRRVIKGILDRFSTRRNYSSTHVENNRELFYNAHSNKILMLPDGIRVKKQKKMVFFNKISSELVEPRPSL